MAAKSRLSTLRLRANSVLMENASVSPGFMDDAAGVLQGQQMLTWRIAGNEGESPGKMERVSWMWLVVTMDLDRRDEMRRKGRTLTSGFRRLSRRHWR